MADLLTSRWSHVYQHSKTTPIAEFAFVPVRISIQGPRFWSAAKEFPKVPELMPYGLFKITDRDEFTPKFEARLEDAGVDTIQAAFDQIDADYQKPLILLCYEDLSKTWCHRQVFADWWQRQTGQAVLEANELSAAGIKGTLA